jgi:hypothetical protein
MALLRKQRRRWGELDTAFARLADLGLERHADEEDDRRHRAACPVCSGPDALSIVEPLRYAPIELRCENGCEIATIRHALGLVPDGRLARELERGPYRSGTAGVGGRDSGQSDEAEPWRPLPSAPPAFPLHALPVDMRRWAEAISEETQTPVDLAAITGLGVLSAAVLGPTAESRRRSTARRASRDRLSAHS